MVTEVFHWHTSAFVLSRLPPTQGCAVNPLCHFESFFGVFALFSHFSKLSAIWHLTSLHDGQRYSQCFPLPSALLPPRQFFSSDHPTSYNFFCTHPPSTTILLITLCLSAHVRWLFIGLSSQHSLDWFQPHSFQHPTLVRCCPFVSVDHPVIVTT